jgi:hypothetical protein
MSTEFLLKDILQFFHFEDAKTILQYLLSQSNLNSYKKNH